MSLRMSFCSTLVALSILVLPVTAGAGLPLEPGDLLGSTGLAGGNLIEIDPMTGAGSDIGSLGTFGPVTEIEFRSDGVLFGTTGAGTANVITIDPETGMETLVGQHGPGSVNGLEFVGDTLYGSYLSGGAGEGGNVRLVTVDQMNGALTDIGPIPGYFVVRGLAYDENAGIMYGIGTQGFGDELFTVDLGTGNPTPIGPIGFFLGGIEFGPDGILYGGDDGGGVGVVGTALLVTVDPGTGNGTAVGQTGSPAISGLAFVPGGGAGPGMGPVQAIPTLGDVSLVLLALLIVGAGLVALRRL